MLLFTGWLQGVGKCYHFPNEASWTWSEAKQYCEDLDSVMVGGVERYPSLLVPENEVEVELLQRFLIPAHTYWINCARGQDLEFVCKTNQVGGTTEYRSKSTYD